MMNPYRFHMPTEVWLKPEAVEHLTTLFEPPGTRPIIICGRSSARRNGTLEALLTQFPKAAVFEEVEENPGTDTCDRAARLCRESGADWVIGLGGGSPMDAAKAVALTAPNPGACRDHFGKEHEARNVLPIVAIPTTAGTGSEVTPYAVLVDEVIRQKRTLRGTALFPRYAVLDPVLTLPLPRAVTINTGLDALSQAMEGMVSRRATEFGNAIALEVCRQVRRWLPVAADQPDDIGAREEMLHAAMLSGCVIAQSGTTLVHGIGYYYTLDHGIPHGLANALLLAPVFRYNANYLPETICALAGALGVPTAASPQGAAQAITEALHGLLGDLGISPAAADWGVPEAVASGLAETICADRGRFKNQIGEPKRDELEVFLLESIRGV